MRTGLVSFSAGGPAEYFMNNKQEKKYTRYIQGRNCYKSFCPFRGTFVKMI